MTLAHRDPVADELAVRDLVHRYADAVTRRDADGVAALFVPDGEWTVTGHGQPTGRAEIAAFLDSLLGGWDAIVHALLSGRIHLDPADHNRAVGRWYISEFGMMSSGTEVFFSGVYHDEYVREHGIWHFTRRRYDSLFRRVGDVVTTSEFPAGLSFP